MFLKRLQTEMFIITINPKDHHHCRHPDMFSLPNHSVGDLQVHHEYFTFLFLSTEPQQNKTQWCLLLSPYPVCTLARGPSLMDHTYCPLYSILALVFLAVYRAWEFAKFIYLIVFIIFSHWCGSTRLQKYAHPVIPQLIFMILNILKLSLT